QHNVSNDTLLEQAGYAGILDLGHVILEMLRAQNELLEYFSAGLAREYRHERALLERTPDQRLRDDILRLLAGESPDRQSVTSRFDAWHVGIVATGVDVQSALVNLAAGEGCELLHVPLDGTWAWAWISRQQPLSSAELALRIQAAPSQTAMAMGE